MKNTILKIISFFIFILLCVCCSDHSSNEEETSLYVYRLYANNSKYLMSSYDTITIAVGDSVPLSVERDGTNLTDEDYSIISQTGNEIVVEQSEVSLNQYYCIAKYIGSSAVYISDHLSSDTFGTYITFNIVSKIIYYYYEASSYGYKIDVEDSDLKEIIEEEMKNAAPDPNRFNYRYSLEYITPNNGIANLISLGITNHTVSNDTVSGIFTSKIDNGVTNLTIKYDDETFNYQLKPDDSNLKTGYLWRDLTDTYRERYPSKIINEVSTSIKIESISYDVGKSL